MTFNIGDFGTVSKSFAPKKARPYQFRIASAEVYETAAGNTRIRWEASVLDDGFTACTIKDGINIPDTDAAVAGDRKAQFMVKLWNNFFLACDQKVTGNPFKNVDKLAQSLVGYIGHCDYTPYQGPGTNSQTDYVTKAQYTKLLDGWVDTGVSDATDDGGIDL